MKCFENLVGVANDCGGSVSGLYLNDLPAISIQNADATINSEYYSGVELLKRKIDFAQNAITSLVRQQLVDTLKVNSIVNNDTCGIYKNGLNPIGTNEQGIRVQIKNFNSLEFYLQSIKLNLQYTGDIDVNVYDLITGDLLDVFSTTVESGKYTLITANKSYLVNRQNLDIVIVVDATLGQSQKTDLRAGWCGDCKPTYTCSYYSIGGVNYDGVNATSINSTNGISIDYSVNCSTEPFICSMGSLLAWGIMHKAGAEVIKEMKYSNRLNNIVLINRDDFDELIEQYENEYMASIKGVLNGLKLPQNDFCFNCNTKLKQVVQIP